ncbi:cell division protein FtsQ [Lachnospiraceae bacterium NE2001]|nr:cell division protein FtsQ [Lachnospiraceae bacterium NE2001]
MRTKVPIIPIIILVLLLGGMLYASTYTLKTIEITGCEMSSEAEVREYIEGKALMDNTLLLYLNNKFGDSENIPFVSKMDIEFVSKHKVKVEVYEKSVAGCIEYMECYVFFDKDGIVMETDKERREGVPYIKGLSVKSWELGQKLPIDNKKKFDMILNITQLLEKYELEIQGIRFTADGEIVLTHDNIEIELGDGSNIAVQLMNLGSILEAEGLEGKTGTLYMKDYSQDNPIASFKVK